MEAGKNSILTTIFHMEPDTIEMFIQNIEHSNWTIPLHKYNKLKNTVFQMRCKFYNVLNFTTQGDIGYNEDT